MTTKSSAQLNRIYPTQVSALLHGIMLAREAELLDEVKAEDIVFQEAGMKAYKGEVSEVTYMISVLGEPRDRAELTLTRKEGHWVVTRVEPD